MSGGVLNYIPSSEVVADLSSRGGMALSQALAETYGEDALDLRRIHALASETNANIAAERDAIVRSAVKRRDKQTEYVSAYRLSDAERTLLTRNFPEFCVEPGVKHHDHAYAAVSQALAARLLYEQISPASCVTDVGGKLHKCLRVPNVHVVAPLLGVSDIPRRKHDHEYARTTAVAMSTRKTSDSAVAKNIIDNLATLTQGEGHVRAYCPTTIQKCHHPADVFVAIDATYDIPPTDFFDAMIVTGASVAHVSMLWASHLLVGWKRWTCTQERTSWSRDGASIMCRVGNSNAYVHKTKIYFSWLNLPAGIYHHGHSFSVERVGLRGQRMELRITRVRGYLPNDQKACHSFPYVDLSHTVVVRVPAGPWSPAKYHFVAENDWTRIVTHLMSVKDVMDAKKLDDTIAAGVRYARTILTTVNINGRTIETRDSSQDVFYIIMVALVTAIGQRHELRANIRRGVEAAVFETKMANASAFSLFIDWILQGCPNRDPLDGPTRGKIARALHCRLANTLNKAGPVQLPFVSSKQWVWWLTYRARDVPLSLDAFYSLDLMEFEEDSSDGASSPVSTVTVDEYVDHSAFSTLVDTLAGIHSNDPEYNPYDLILIRNLLQENLHELLPTNVARRYDMGAHGRLSLYLPRAEPTLAAWSIVERKMFMMMTTACSMYLLQAEAVRTLLSRYELARDGLTFQDRLAGTMSTISVQRGMPTNGRDLLKAYQYVFYNSKFYAVGVDGTVPDLPADAEYVIVADALRFFHAAGLLDAIGSVRVLKPPRASIVGFVGTAGCGKSYAIVHALQPGDCVLVPTRESKRAMVDDVHALGVSDVHVYTYGGAIIHLQELSAVGVRRIFADEAWMMASGISLFLASVLNVEMLYMFGDPQQIPYTSFVADAAPVAALPTADMFYRQVNMTISRRVTPHQARLVAARYGEQYKAMPLRSDLRETPVSYQLYTDLAAAPLMDFDVVLVYTQDAKSIVRAAHPEVNVMTAHEAQGGTWLTVALVRDKVTDNIQFKVDDRGPVTMLTAEQLVAFTRAKQRTVYFTPAIDELTKYIDSRAVLPLGDYVATDEDVRAVEEAISSALMDSFDTRSVRSLDITSEQRRITVSCFDGVATAYFDSISHLQISVDDVSEVSLRRLHISLPCNVKFVVCGCLDGRRRIKMVHVLRAVFPDADVVVSTTAAAPIVMGKTVNGFECPLTMVANSHITTIPIAGKDVHVRPDVVSVDGIAEDECALASAFGVLRPFGIVDLAALRRRLPENIYRRRDAREYVEYVLGDAVVMYALTGRDRALVPRDAVSALVYVNGANGRLPHWYWITPDGAHSTAAVAQRLRYDLKIYVLVPVLSIRDIESVDNVREVHAYHLSADWFRYDDSSSLKHTGYCCRSAFKLHEILNRTNPFAGGLVVDLGAAPGGFYQAISRIVVRTMIPTTYVAVTLPPPEGVVWRAAPDERVPLLHVNCDIRRLDDLRHALDEAVGQRVASYLLFDAATDMRSGEPYHVLHTPLLRALCEFLSTNCGLIDADTIVIVKLFAPPHLDITEYDRCVAALAGQFRDRQCLRLKSTKPTSTEVYLVLRGWNVREHTVMRWWLEARASVVRQISDDYTALRNGTYAPPVDYCDIVSPSAESGYSVDSPLSSSDSIADYATCKSSVATAVTANQWTPCAAQVVQDIERDMGIQVMGGGSDILAAIVTTGRFDAHLVARFVRRSVKRRDECPRIIFEVNGRYGCDDYLRARPSVPGHWVYVPAGIDYVRSDSRIYAISWRLRLSSTQRTVCIESIAAGTAAAYGYQFGARVHKALYDMALFCADESVTTRSKYFHVFLQKISAATGRDITTSQLTSCTVFDCVPVFSAERGVFHLTAVPNTAFPHADTDDIATGSIVADVVRIPSLFGARLTSAAGKFLRRTRPITGRKVQFIVDAIDAADLLDALHGLDPRTVFRSDGTITVTMRPPFYDFTLRKGRVLCMHTALSGFGKYGGFDQRKREIRVDAPDCLHDVVDAEPATLGLRSAVLYDVACDAGYAEGCSAAEHFCRFYPETVADVAESAEVVAVADGVHGGELQSHFDVVAPRVAAVDMVMQVELLRVADSLLAYNDNMRITPAKMGTQRPFTFPVVQPILRTSETGRRYNEFSETLTALSKRNFDSTDVSLPAGPAFGPMAVANAFDVVCVSDWRQRLAALPPVCPSPDLLQDWLARLETAKLNGLLATLRDVVDVPFDVYDISLKDVAKSVLDNKAALTYTLSQVIAAAAPEVSVYASGVFRTLMARLQSILRPEFVILSGGSRVEYERYFNHIWTDDLRRVTTAVEADASNFDKTQLGSAHAVKMAAYRMLGLDDTLAELWERSHVVTRNISRQAGISFDVMYQHKSGDPTTTLGNCIVTTVAFVLAYGQCDIRAMAVLGDDNVALLGGSVRDVDAVGRMSRWFNVQTKILLYDVPYMCGHFVLNTSDGVRLMPDPLKRLSKLGSNTMRTEEHLRDAFESFRDITRAYFDPAANELLEDAVVERYALTSHVRGLCDALYSLASEYMLFRELWRVVDESSHI